VLDIPGVTKGTELAVQSRRLQGGLPTETVRQGVILSDVALVDERCFP